MAKRVASRYEAGRRSAAWRKIKNVHRQEFVVGGWKPGEGTRSHLIGSLMVGVQGPDGLTFAGHVGTGFTQQALRELTARLGRCAAPRHHSARPSRPIRPAARCGPSLTWSSRPSSRSGPAPDGCARRPTAGCADDKDPADVIRE